MNLGSNSAVYHTYVTGKVNGNVVNDYAGDCLPSVKKACFTPKYHLGRYATWDGLTCLFKSNQNQIHFAQEQYTLYKWNNSLVITNFIV